MDESQIVAQLAQGVPKEDSPIANPAPLPAPEDGGLMHNGLPLETQLQRQELLDYFELPSSYRKNPEVLQQIDNIITWARDNASSTEMADIFRIINRQENMLGSKLKPGRIAKLNRYIHLHNQGRAIDEQMRSLYG